MILRPRNGEGLRLHYVGFWRQVGQVEGELTFLLVRTVVGGVHQEQLVVFDAWAARGQLGLALGDIHLMIERTRVH